MVKRIRTWLESDDEFEGVGAHRDNPRYDPVDEDGYDDVTGAPIDEPGPPPPPPDGWRPFDGSEPDVDHDTGDERKTGPD